MEAVDIIKKAVEKASKNESGSKEDCNAALDRMIILTKNQPAIFKAAVTEIIFSHAFVKAYWGTTTFCCPNHMEYKANTRITCSICHYSYRKVWQVHIQQMALEENRLQYVRRFL